jgi:hypothetical protein
MTRGAGWGSGRWAVPFMGWFLVRAGPFLGRSVHRIGDRLNGVVCAYGRERVCSDGNIRGF